MIFREQSLSGVQVIDIERKEDERGFFGRTWCAQEFADHGLNPALVQCSLSFNRKRGTLRGMHYQARPHEEAKLIRCSMGAIHDVIIDLRPGSATYKKWLGVELTAESRRMLYVPEGFAHGFITLVDATEVIYHMSTLFHADSARGVRWDDPAFGIRWPMPPAVIAPRDQQYPDYTGPSASSGEPTA
jgi:dTDP-4-dehydrorhamnose 3,5-epimerase